MSAPSPSSARDPAAFSGHVDELAAALNSWAAREKIFPISGQASREITVRNLRYYRSLALLDGPIDGGGYGPKHFLQVAAIRLLQARGLPLARIRDLLYGRSEKELADILREGVDELHQPPPVQSLLAPGETWTVHGLPGNFALLAPTGQTLTTEQLDAIAEILTRTNQSPTTRKPNQP